MGLHNCILEQRGLLGQLQDHCLFDLKDYRRAWAGGHCLILDLFASQNIAATDDATPTQDVQEVCLRLILISQLDFNYA